MSTTDEICATIEGNLATIKVLTAESIAEARRQAYEEILQGLVDVEREALEMTEDNVRKLARYFAVISEVRESVQKFKGMRTIPVETLEAMRHDRCTTAEINTLFLMCRYSDALRDLEAERPKLARMLFSVAGRK